MHNGDGVEHSKCGRRAGGSDELLDLTSNAALAFAGGNLNVGVLQFIEPFAEARVIDIKRERIDLFADFRCFAEHLHAVPRHVYAQGLVENGALVVANPHCAVNGRQEKLDPEAVLARFRQFRVCFHQQRKGFAV